MTVTDYFIDDAGDLVRTFGVMRLRLNSTLPDDVLSNFLIRNMGFICIKESPRGVEIKLAPHAVSAMGLIALLYWLADRGNQRFAYTVWRGNSWQTSIENESAQLKRKMLMLLDESGKRSGLPQPFLAVSSKELRLKWGVKLDLLKRLAQACPTITELASLTSSLVQGRFTIVAPAADRHFVVKHIGGRYRFLDRQWQRRPIGLDVSDLSDAEYGRWISGSFSRALSCHDALYEDVDAMVRGSGGGRHRYRYRRVLTKLLDLHGQPLILTASLDCGDIDLRSKLISEAG